MRNNNSENPNEKLEFILSSLIDFSNNNEFDYSLYKSFAEDSSKSFIRYFSQIEDQTIKEKIISDLHTDFYFIVNDAVTNMLASNQNNGSVSEDEIYISQPIPDNRIRSYESNYMKLKETFLNLVLTEIKPQESKTIEAEKVEIEPQEIETVKTDEVKTDEVKKELYNHIFKNNAIEVFQSMFDSFGITEKSRTDVKFIFEEMKKDGLIQKTVNQKTFLDWLSELPYEISVQKTSNYSKTHKRNSIYSTAKELYKK
jgi:hypothetical protein